MDNVIDKIKGLKENTKGEFQGEHPIHGSSKGERGDNFSIDVENNRWHCYRCDTGGDAISLTGVLEGIIDCSDCTKGFFKSNPEKFKQILQVAEKKYGYIPEKKQTRRKKVPLILVEKHFNTGEVAEYICQEIKFMLMYSSTGQQEEIYYYKDGLYIKKGLVAIKKLLKKMIAEQHLIWKSNWENELRKYLQSEQVVDREKIEVSKDLVNFNNGTYNIKTDELTPHSYKNLFLYKIPIDYKPNAKCPKITKYFESTLKPEYIKLAQELFGYCLLNNYSIASIFYLLGSGGNGKSVFIHLLIEMLGKENVATKEISSLINNRFTTSLLNGKLANVSGELTRSVLRNTDKLKGLSAGDRVEAELKGLDGFDFENKAKIITACNELQPANDTTTAWYERQYIIPFLKTFRGKKGTEIKGYKHKLTANKKEMEGLLIWSLEGLKRLMDNEEFSYPQGAEQKLRYILYTNSVRYFIDEFLVKADYNAFETQKDLRKEYLKLCKENDVPPESETELGRKLQEAGMNTDRIKIGTKWVWIRRFCTITEKQVKEQKVEI